MHCWWHFCCCNALCIRFPVHLGCLRQKDIKNYGAHDWKRRKGPHPHTFGPSKKIARFTKGRFVPIVPVYKDLDWPYEGQFCGKIDWEGSWWAFSQRTAKVASGKGPRQKMSKIFKKCQHIFDTSRHFFPHGKNLQTFAAVLRGNTIRGNTTRNSERKMALWEGLWEGLWKTSENLWKPLKTLKSSDKLWKPLKTSEKLWKPLKPSLSEVLSETLSEADFPLRTSQACCP